MHLKISRTLNFYFTIYTAFVNIVDEVFFIEGRILELSSTFYLACIKLI